MKDGLRRTLMIAALCSVAVAAQAQTQPAPATPPAQGSVPAVIGAERSQETATVTFTNRPIVELRARVLGRSPDERAAGAERSLEDLASQGITGPVESSVFEGGAIIRVANRGVVVLTNADVDDLAGETLGSVTALAVAHLQQALSEADEIRAPGRIIRAAMAAFAALAFALVVLWAIRRRSSRSATGRPRMSERQHEIRIGRRRVRPLIASPRFPARPVVHHRRRARAARHLPGTAFVLRQFLYTRPWGRVAPGGFL
jgi:hypothetical protein